MVTNITRRLLPILALVCAFGPSLQAQQPFQVRFKGVVGDQPLACGKEYAIGVNVTPKDFRFYIREFRVVDDKGAEIAVDLEQDGKWQLDGIALLDFEDRTGACDQGTPEMNDRIKATVPTGTVVRGIRFKLGVPPERNHAGNLRAAPAPLNLTAMIWSWAEGYVFLRADYLSSRAFAIHVGDVQDNLPWPDIEFTGFDPSADVVVADWSELVKSLGGNGGCMHNCPTRVIALGVGNAAPQTFFRKESAPESK